MKILVFGSLNIDRRYTVDHFVMPGETLSSQALGTFSGGKGLNQAIACKKAGSDVYMAGKIGTDGAFLLGELKDADVVTKHVFIDEDEFSGHAIIQVDKNGQNCIILYGGTNRTITQAEVDEVLADFEAGDILLLQNEINAMDYIIDKASEKGMLIALNPSPMDDELLKCDLSKVTYFIMNEIEAAAIAGSEDPDKAIEVLHEKYPHSKIVVTLGGDGSKYFDGERTYQHGIYSVKAVDTTAAGDTFTGYFLNGILEGMQPLEIMSMAAKASAIAVSRPGAADSIPTKDEVMATALELK
ncbi:MAG: ribokinase [Oscillospiraceae bacterium]|nr:ribokinase [Oscillospiraceae bacterium]